MRSRLSGPKKSCTLCTSSHVRRIYAGKYLDTADLKDAKALLDELQA